MGDKLLTSLGRSVLVDFIPPPGWKAPAVSVKYEEDSNDPEILEQLARFKRCFPGDSAKEYITRLSNVILSALYGRAPWAVPTDVASITLIIHDFDGLAHVSGGWDKEMHVSLRFLCGVHPEEQLTHVDFDGILTHEMVHVWQNSNGISSGLMEGIADYFRALLNTPRDEWKIDQDINADWDGGYQTTGYFLLWIELDRVPPTPNFVVNLNATLKLREWSMDFFPQLVSDRRDCHSLWWEYQRSLGDRQVVIPPTPLDISRRLVTYQVYTLHNKSEEGMLYCKPDGRIKFGTSPRDKSTALWLLGVCRDGLPFFTLFNVSKREVLDVECISQDDDAKVLSFEGHGEHNQQWLLTQPAYYVGDDVPDRDAYRIVARHSGKALTLSSDPDARLVQRGFEGRDEQYWIFRKVE
ncbi:peptidase of plants and bacteria-domain-containing protein [Chytridium lagenaria]|nr:peptidase of plants and bacteria-domain-containing protein [Chytridium lagenaria]